MSDISLATLRLGKDSVEDIKKINAAKTGIVQNEFQFSVTCTQVPAEFNVGVIVFLWLGSDNSKGIPTEWKQGFKSVGTVLSINRGDKYNDPSVIEVSLKYVFKEAINRLDILQKAPTAYYWCSALPIIGLDDHSNQTVRMIIPDGERSDIRAFLYVLNTVRPEFRDEIITVYPELEPYFDYAVPDPNVSSSEKQQNSVAQEKESALEKVRWKHGTNELLYGVPGSGKSWTIEHEYCPEGVETERLVFHPDYTNADFIGQILPVVDADKQVTYEFTPGPFTLIIEKAFLNPSKRYVLIIEEINRGNAPAIFGEVFQLLDRTITDKRDEGILYPAGTSEYGVTQKNMAEKIYGDPDHKVRIPSNLSIIATMNTSDQNVFTLDTAFQRRWHMRLIENSFDNVRESLAQAEILDTGVTWQKFCETINRLIIKNRSKMSSAEDKRLGVYFIHENDIDYKHGKVTIEQPSDPYPTLRKEYNALVKDPNADPVRLEAIRKSIRDISIFPEKVIKYLWDDAFKFNPDALFNVQGDNKLESLEDVINVFVDSYDDKRFNVFKPEVRDLLYQ